MESAASTAVAIVVIVGLRVRVTDHVRGWAHHMRLVLILILSLILVLHLGAHLLLLLPGGLSRLDHGLGLLLLVGPGLLHGLLVLDALHVLHLGGLPIALGLNVTHLLLAIPSVGD